MDALTYWRKKWLIVNWLLKVSMWELDKAFKENQRLKKRYFIISGKLIKWIKLNPTEAWDKMRFSNIFWE